MPRKREIRAGDIVVHKSGEQRVVAAVQGNELCPSGWEMDGVIWATSDCIVISRCDDIRHRWTMQRVYDIEDPRRRLNRWHDCSACRLPSMKRGRRHDRHHHP